MRRTVLLLAVLPMVFAPAPLPRRERGGAKEADLAALQGVWETVSLRVEGVNLSQGTTTTIEGRRMTVSVRNVVAARWEMRLDATSGPRALDLVDGRTVLLCIYRLEGDRLTLCWHNGDGRARPTDFRGSRGLGLEVLRRGKR